MVVVLNNAGHGLRLASVFDGNRDLFLFLFPILFPFLFVVVVAGDSNLSLNVKSEGLADDDFCCFDASSR